MKILLKDCILRGATLTKIGDLAVKFLAKGSPDSSYTQGDRVLLERAWKEDAMVNIEIDIPDDLILQTAQEFTPEPSFMPCEVCRKTGCDGLVHIQVPNLQENA